MSKDSFLLVFFELRSILEGYADRLSVTQDGQEAYSLSGAFSPKWGRELFFASTLVKKNYVSYYLMPVYMYPILLAKISPELIKRMQGKSCFNFKQIDKTLFDELAQLTKQGFELFVKTEFGGL